MKIRKEDADQIALLERKADDVLRIAKSIEGLMNLRVGQTTIGLNSTEYVETLSKLITESTVAAL